MTGSPWAGHSARRWLVGGIVLAGLAAGVGGTVAAAENGQVAIDNFAFAPTPMTVPVGTMVKWLNRDDIPHSIVVQALGVHSHPMDTDESFTYRFEKPGTYDYICGLHPFMHGKIVVQN